MIVAELSCASEKGVSLCPPLRRGDHGHVPAGVWISSFLVGIKNIPSNPFSATSPPKGGHSQSSEEREAGGFRLYGTVLQFPASPSKEV